MNLHFRPIGETGHLAVLPKRAHSGDAGLDLSSTEDVLIPAGGFAVVGTGLRVDVPHNYVGLIHSRSGLAARNGVSVLNAPGVIDAGYEGELKVILTVAAGAEDFQVKQGDRIAQFILQEVVLAQPIFATEETTSPDQRAVFGGGTQEVGELRDLAAAGTPRATFADAVRAMPLARPSDPHELISGMYASGKVVTSLKPLGPARVPGLREAIDDQKKTSSRGAGGLGSTGVA